MYAFDRFAAGDVIELGVDEGYCCICDFKPVPR